MASWFDNARFALLCTGREPARGKAPREFVDQAADLPS